MLFLILNKTPLICEEFLISKQPLGQKEFLTTILDKRCVDISLHPSTAENRNITLFQREHKSHKPLLPNISAVIAISMRKLLGWKMRLKPQPIEWEVYRPITTTSSWNIKRKTGKSLKLSRPKLRMNHNNNACYILQKAQLKTNYTSKYMSNPLRCNNDVEVMR